MVSLSFFYHKKIQFSVFQFFFSKIRARGSKAGIGRGRTRRAQPKRPVM
jgi:hypothetical protein